MKKTIIICTVLTLCGLTLNVALNSLFTRTYVSTIGAQLEVHKKDVDRQIDSVIIQNRDYSWDFMEARIHSMLFSESGYSWQQHGAMFTAYTAEVCRLEKEVPEFLENVELCDPITLFDHRTAE
jgi:hypothetical protein